MTGGHLKEFEDQDDSLFKVTNRDRALFLIAELNLEAQLVAIKGAIKRNRREDAVVSRKIGELEEHIRACANRDQGLQMQLEDCWVDAMHDSVFQDATYSMAAVGMLAPFIESLFVSIFSGLREYEKTTNNTLRDDVRIAASQDEFWDPHFVFKQGGRHRNLVAGTGQLARTTGLAEFLPSDCDKILSALFAYRNKMFHLGFEWPMVEKIKFDEHVRSADWPAEWFRKSTIGDNPWIFYMSAEFIEHCIKTTDEVLEGVGAFLLRAQD